MSLAPGPLPDLHRPRAGRPRHDCSSALLHLRAPARAHARRPPSCSLAPPRGALLRVHQAKDDLYIARELSAHAASRVNNSSGSSRRSNQPRSPTGGQQDGDGNASGGDADRRAALREDAATTAAAAAAAMPPPPPQQQDCAPPPHPHPHDHELLLRLALGAAAAQSSGSGALSGGGARTAPAAAAAAALAGFSLSSVRPPWLPANAAAAAPPAQQTTQTPPPPRLLLCPSLVVFSGGTAFNSVAGPLRHLTTAVAHVLPVSDDGGSTAEIVRVLGGPAVGDIRSRCLRLADDGDAEARAVKRLLAHRLPSGARSSSGGLSGGGAGAGGGPGAGAFLGGGGGGGSAAAAAEAAAGSAGGAAGGRAEHRGGAADDRARLEWYEVVEGRHPLWRGVSEPYKHVIRAFLLHFHTQIMAQAAVLSPPDGAWGNGGGGASHARPPPTFNFTNGSVGNFFFAGARTFFRSLESAVFLFSRVARIPEGSLVLPAICTEERITLGAELEDGTVVRGQNAISHPLPLPAAAAAAAAATGAAAAAAVAPFSSPSFLAAGRAAGGAAAGPGGPRTEGGSPARVAALSGDEDDDEDGDGGGERGAAAALPLFGEPAPADDGGRLVVDKRAASCPPLPAPVRRVFYLSREGTGREHEVSPRANPRVTGELARCDAVVYAMGSLYTSICPALCLEGVGEAVAARGERAAKVLVLNGTHDRETSLARGRAAAGAGAGAGAGGGGGPDGGGGGGGAPGALRPPGPMTASDVVRAVVDALNRSRPPRRRRTSTAVARAGGGGGGDGGGGTANAAADGSAAAAPPPPPPPPPGPHSLNHPPSAYVTALIVPRGGEIEVDREELARLGVTTVVEVDATVEEEGEEQQGGEEEEQGAPSPPPPRAGAQGRGAEEGEEQQGGEEEEQGAPSPPPPRAGAQGRGAAASGGGVGARAAGRGKPAPEPRPSSASPRPPSAHRRVLYDSEALVYAIGRVIYGLTDEEEAGGGEGPGAGEGGRAAAGGAGAGGGGGAAGGDVGAGPSGVIVPGGISLAPPPFLRGA